MKLRTLFKPTLGLATLLAVTAADSEPLHGISIGVLVFKMEGGEPTSFTSSFEIPLTPGGQVWGWELMINSAAPDQKIHLVEELSVAGPARWDETEEGVKISSDHTTWTKTIDVRLKNRRYIDVLKTGDKNPPGPGMLTMTVNGMRQRGVALNFISDPASKPK